MQVDVGLDTVGLPDEDEAHMTLEAARLGYRCVWTGSGGDPFQTCVRRQAAMRAAGGGFGTAIGVLPVGLRTPADMALSAAALTAATGGQFILGIGAGNTWDPAYRRTWGIRERSPLALVRAYLTTMRGFLAGESVTYHDQSFSYDDARLPGPPASTPLYLGVAGPEMARLGGELADGVYLSWCTPDNVKWARTCLTEGAERVQRDPARVRLAASVRVCVDDDVQVARRALAAALLPYVLGWGSTPPRPFLNNFARMGFGPELAELDRMRRAGLDRQYLIEAFPERMLSALGYFGPAGGAAEAIRRQLPAADTAVVRVVPARPGISSVGAILEACRSGPTER